MSTQAPQHWYGSNVGASPTFERVLIVDDSNFYAEHLTADLAARGAHIERARNAGEGIRLLENRGVEFDAVITDISMETELAGLRVLRKARRCSFRGLVATATTGLDHGWSFTLNRFVLGILYQSDFLIPKRPIDENGHVLWIRVRG